MHASKVGELNREPNVVPMIDILLVLLIAAILGLLPKWKIDLQLPVPAESGAPSVPLVLSIAPGPSYSLNGTAIASDSLIPHLAAVFAPRPEKVLFVKADPTVRYQDVFYAFGAVRGAGVKVTAIVPADRPR